VFRFRITEKNILTLNIQIYFVFHFQHTWGIIKLCQYATHFGVGQNQAIMSKIKFRKL
jgi:hypothetical protein